MTVVSIYYWLSLREFTLAPCYFKFLDRCSGCSTSYTMFFGVRIYISSLWPWLCHNIFNVMRIALLFLLLSFFFLYVNVSRMFVVNSVFRRCTRCQWLFSVLRCRPMLVVASLRDGDTCIARFCDLYEKNRHESVSRSATPSLAKIHMLLYSSVIRTK